MANSLWAALMVGLAVVGTLGSPTASAAEKGFSSFSIDPEESRLSTASLVVTQTSADDPGSHWVGVRIRLGEGWHTYWRNPGDSGAPSAVHWSLPRGATASPIQWPAPDLFRVGPVISFGYKDEAWLIARISSDPPLAADAMIRAEVLWLVCADICVPQRADLNVSVQGEKDDVQALALTRAIESLPEEFPGPTSAYVDDNRIRFRATLPEEESASFADFRFFPDEFGVIDYAADQAATVAGGVLSMALARNRSVSLQSESLNGVLVFRSGDRVRAFEISTPLTSRGEP